MKDLSHDRTVEAISSQEKTQPLAMFFLPFSLLAPCAFHAAEPSWYLKPILILKHFKHEFG